MSACQELDVTGHVDLERGLLNPEIFFSEEIYRAELEFVRSGLALCRARIHDSNDGRLRSDLHGRGPVLVVRQRDGSIRAFLNQCRHRGMRICRAAVGNTKAFTCTYHGWTYDIAGKLINVSHEEDGDHNELDKDAWGPVQVAEVREPQGLRLWNL